jgi:hypothetical protein
MRYFLLAVLLLAACGNDDPPPPAQPPPQGRVETRGIRATEAIGLPGKAIANKVDAALEANSQASRKMQEAERKQLEDDQGPTDPP